MGRGSHDRTKKLCDAIFSRIKSVSDRLAAEQASSVDHLERESKRPRKSSWSPLADGLKPAGGQPRVGMLRKK